MAKTKFMGVGVLVGVLVACGSDVAEEAGDMMRDAGEAIADAGAAIADAAGGDAQALTDAGSPLSKLETLDVACSVELTETYSAGGNSIEMTRWYAELDAVHVVSVSGCERELLPKPFQPCQAPLAPGATCTGQGAPEPVSKVCGWPVRYEQGASKVRVHCGEREHRSATDSTTGEWVKSVRLTVLR